MSVGGGGDGSDLSFLPRPPPGVFINPTTATTTAKHHPPSTPKYSGSNSNGPAVFVTSSRLMSPNGYPRTSDTMATAYAI
eukprot:CAMPEP_0181375332 /NCGR_PEP_ID=MMETSP1106-20121128/16585_1 /TAXON_ID=81844 /ORGANISM="Mantoniella antarctica, Strain SL-175" /LENGTH=79 /DNA_ID=CAMNT_0023493549 /DNA_START=60 /DNA_END=296 /DNA_ORIENTATION=+